MDLRPYWGKNVIVTDVDNIIYRGFVTAVTIPGDSDDNCYEIDLIRTKQYRDGYFTLTEYEKEYKAASKYFSVGLINQERLFEDNVVTTTYKISNDDIIIYRGWMLKPQLYDRLVTYVEKNGGQMFTNL